MAKNRYLYAKKECHYACLLLCFVLFLEYSSSGYQVSGVIDEYGGLLSLPDIASCNIPKGAVKSKLKASLGVCLENDYPGMEEGEIAITPVVQCGPDGITFSEAVDIAISHCAVDLNASNIRVHYKGHDQGKLHKMKHGQFKTAWKCKIWLTVFCKTKQIF